MVTNFFTLRALTLELERSLGGSWVAEVFTQSKNELLITLHGAAEEASGTLSVSVAPGLNYVILRERVARARRNSVDLFQDMVSKRIGSIEIDPGDRTLILNMENGWRLLIQQYNTASSNIILADEKNIVGEAFKNNKHLAGTFFRIEERISPERAIEDAPSFIRKLSADGSMGACAALKKNLPALGLIYAREVLYRSGIDENMPISEMGNDLLKRIRDETAKIIQESLNPEPMVYFRGSRMLQLSLMPLGHLRGTEVKKFSSVNDAVKYFVIGALQGEETESEIKSISDGIKTELERTKRALGKSERQARIDPGEYEKAGKLLLAHLPDICKGMKEVELQDVIGGSGTVKIALDPSLPPVANAERYFNKAKATRASLEKSAKRIVQLAAKVDLLTQAEMDIGNCSNRAQLEKFLSEHRQDLKRLKMNILETAGAQPPFRVFTVAGGYEVWVGKNNVNNDMLTMKYAKPQDLWFHVRGAGGSHTVLRVKDSQAAVPKEAIVQAAAIAAYYSKMRKAGSVPVAYCERKYVRKPRGLAAGAVVLEREKVIFVNPKLP